MQNVLSVVRPFLQIHNFLYLFYLDTDFWKEICCCCHSLFRNWRTIAKWICNFYFLSRHSRLSVKREISSTTPVHALQGADNLSNFLQNDLCFYKKVFRTVQFAWRTDDFNLLNHYLSNVPEFVMFLQVIFYHILYFTVTEHIGYWNGIMYVEIFRYNPVWKQPNWLRIGHCQCKRFLFPNELFNGKFVMTFSLHFSKVIAEQMTEELTTRIAFVLVKRVAKWVSSLH